MFNVNDPSDFDFSEEFEFHLSRLESDPNVSSERIQAFIDDWEFMKEFGDNS